MLASNFSVLDEISYPVLVTPKIDGIRCLVLNLNGIKQVVSRSLKPIRNTFVREWILQHVPAGVDGELVIKGGDFHAANSAIMTESGQPDFEFLPFDRMDPDGGSDIPYIERIKMLPDLQSNRVRPLVPLEVSCFEELQDYYQQCLESGYEGIMIRKPQGRYDCGRSENLLKMKEKSDAEAVIEEVIETEGDFFQLGTMESFRVSLLNDRSQLFQIGTGFTHEMRKSFWNQKNELKGRILRFTYQRQGMKSAPRFPVFAGFRDEDDL